MSEENADTMSGANQRLFWGCFLALIATAFGFIVRTFLIGDWAEDFGFDATQSGQILGAGIWPFALSIIFFSLVIDKIGYGKAMVFAFVCHGFYAVLTIFATGYTSLYIASFVFALGNGAVEAVINPVVATMFRENKTKWLNILHAGWPGGLVLAGLLAIGMGEADWKLKVALIFIPMIGYGILLFGQKFPVHERVESGVSYLAMLKEVGIIGAFIAVGLMTAEVGRIFEIPGIGQIIIVLVLTGAYGVYVKSLGQPLFIFLLIIMMPLATTEIGTDSWITPLMEPVMEEMNFNPGWVLVYTSFIMMVLRFFAGPIVHRLSPLGLLAGSALVAALGLLFLSKATGGAILLAATLYGFGKTFFWPTMLGVVAERFPKGGAMTLNTIAGVGMLSVGTVGAMFLGNIQDVSTAKTLEANNPVIYGEYVVEKDGTFGSYMAVDADKAAEAPAEVQEVFTAADGIAKKAALKSVAILPIFMLVCYLILIFYFRSKGGYAVVHIDSDEEAA